MRSYETYPRTVGLRLRSGLTRIWRSSPNFLESYPHPGTCPSVPRASGHLQFRVSLCHLPVPWPIYRSWLKQDCSLCSAPGSSSPFSLSLRGCVSNCDLFKWTFSCSSRSGGQDMGIALDCPWFQAWLNCLLAVCPQTSHFASVLCPQLWGNTRTRSRGYWEAKLEKAHQDFSPKSSLNSVSCPQNFQRNSLFHLRWLELDF